MAAGMHEVANALIMVKADPMVRASNGRNAWSFANTPFAQQYLSYYNVSTQEEAPSQPPPAADDRDRHWIPPPHCFKEAAKLKGGSQEPGRNIVASITKKQAEEIAKKKMKDLNAYDLEQATKIIMGSARSMGIEVKE